MKIINISKPDFYGKHTITMFKQVPAKVSSGFLSGLIGVTDQFFAAQLVVGSIAALNYGIRIPTFFTTIIVLAGGNVLLPYFSKLSLNNIQTNNSWYHKITSELLKININGVSFRNEL